MKNLTKKYGQQQAFDAIGYREIIDFLTGKTTLEQAAEKMKINTWHFAKRQTTWFKKDRKIIWIKSPAEAGALCRDWLCRE